MRKRAIWGAAQFLRLWNVGLYGPSPISPILPTSPISPPFVIPSLPRQANFLPHELSNETHPYKIVWGTHELLERLYEHGERTIMNHQRLLRNVSVGITGCRHKVSYQIELYEFCMSSLSGSESQNCFYSSSLVWTTKVSPLA
jgi:hypothetical protein